MSFDLTATWSADRRRFVACISMMLNVSFVSSEPMHDNGTQTIKAEVVEPIVEAQETCREEANTSSSYSPSPRTVYTCNDGKVSLTKGHSLFS